MSYITNALLSFFTDPRVLAILGLILLDLLLGIAAAIQEKRFDWAAVGDFYQTMVLPKVIGYLAFYLAGKVIISVDLLGPAAPLVGEGMIYIAWIAIVLSLAGSIVRNAKALGYEVPEIDEEQ